MPDDPARDGAPSAARARAAARRTAAAVAPVALAGALAAIGLLPGGGAPGATAPAPPGGASLCRTVGAADGFPTLPAPAGGPIRDLTGLQDLRRDMALDGLGPGGDGRGVRVAVVEFDWDPAHVELDGRVPSRPSFRRAGGAGDVSHGTAGLALIGGRA
ncbi:MAG TPA: hypothetical protein VNT51_13690, partial [Miltoncostaeaceae bacterium]|nr:hypothetical protein [Miltoncostaeaceae bacterium]